MANAFLQQTDVLGQGEHHLQVRVFFVGQLPEFLHRPLPVDLVSFLHSDSLLFFLAEKTTAIIMTAVESRYFLRINGHPLNNFTTSTPVLKALFRFVATRPANAWPLYPVRLP